MINSSKCWQLVVIALLPLAVIFLQLYLQLQGVLGYSLYKLFLIVPPLLYCYTYNISLQKDVWKFANWKNGFWSSFWLGMLCIVVFWILYALLAPLFINEAEIVAKIKSQFSVSITTIAFIAPVTIFINSLIEETFYRAFAFGQLQQYSAWFAYMYTSVLFTVQHLMFTYHWVGLGLLLVGILSLFTFAMVACYLYKRNQTVAAPWLMHIFGDIAMMGIAVWLLV